MNNVAHGGSARINDGGTLIYHAPLMRDGSRIQTVIAAIRSAFTYMFVAVYILIAVPLGTLVYKIVGSNAALYWLGHIGVHIALRFAGTRYQVVRDGTPPRGAAVYCSNHQSNLDPPILYHVLHPRLHLLYKAELKRFPILGPAFEPGGFVAVDRNNKEQALEAIDRAARSLQSGNSFLIFPEGTRSRTNDLLPFKSGGFIMAIKAQVPVVPVAVFGGRDAMRRGGKMIRPVTVTVRVGMPVETKGLSVEDRGALMAEVRKRIIALIGQSEHEAGSVA